MHHSFVNDLAVVLCVAAVTAWACHLLRQPVVLGYLVAGLVIGPHLPIPLVADADNVEALSELGISLLMFTVGLEVGVRGLLRRLPSSGLVALVEMSAMFFLGQAVGQLFGWSPAERLFCGAIISVSSTMIVAKAFAERRPDDKVASLVFGVLVVQDLVAILMLAAFSALGGDSLAVSSGKLVGFIICFALLGVVTVPRLLRAVVKLDRAELTLITTVGLCFAGALAARKLGYSVALGAFLAGAVAAESGHGHALHRAMLPLQSIFSAIFFVSVGMQLDPRLAWAHLPAILVLTGVVLVAQPLVVLLGAMLTGHGVRRGLQAGMSLAQVGEFSFLLAGVGVAQGKVGGFLFPVAVTVSALTAFTTPWLVRAAPTAAAWVDRKLPPRVQRLVALYADWIDSLRAKQAPSGQQRMLLVLALDALAFLGVVVGALAGARPLTAWVAHTPRLAALPRRWVLVAIALAAVLAALPLLRGFGRATGRLARSLAAEVLPPVEVGRLDRAAAARKSLTLGVQAAAAVVLTLLTTVATRLAAPWFPSWVILALIMPLLAIALWRRASDLDGHLRAGAAVVLESLASQAHDPAPDLHEVEALLPGLGTLTAVLLSDGSPAVGRTLAELDLRGRTGASALAVARGEVGRSPDPHQPLASGESLVLAGSDEALTAARKILLGAPT